MVQLASGCNLGYQAKWGGNTVQFKTEIASTNVDGDVTPSVVQQFYSAVAGLFRGVSVDGKLEPLADMVVSYLQQSSALYALEGVRPDWVGAVLQNKLDLLTNLTSAADDDEVLLALLTILKATTQRAERFLASQKQVKASLPLHNWNTSGWEGIATGGDESPLQFCFSV